MIVIVEGIDRVGKTTLVNNLSKNLNLPIYKHKIEVYDYSKMDNDNETDKMIQLIDMLEITDSDIIFDRFHFSDYVYGVLERNYDVEKANKNFELIEKRLNSYKGQVLFFMLYPVDIEMSSEKHGKDLKPYQILMDKLFKKSKLNVIGTNYELIRGEI